MDKETFRKGDPKRKFLALKQAFSAYKEGKYSEETLLHFFAGFCGHVPTSEEVGMIES